MGAPKHTAQELPTATRGWLQGKGKGAGVLIDHMCPKKGHLTVDVVEGFLRGQARLGGG